MRYYRFCYVSAVTNPESGRGWTRQVAVSRYGLDSHAERKSRTTVRGKAKYWYVRSFGITFGRNC